MGNSKDEQFINFIERVDLPGHNEVVVEIRNWKRWSQALTPVGTALLVIPICYLFGAGWMNSAMAGLAVLALALVGKILDYFGVAEAGPMAVIGAVLGMAIGYLKFGIGMNVLFSGIAGMFLPLILAAPAFLLSPLNRLATYLVMAPISSIANARIKKNHPEWVSNGVNLQFTWREVKFETNNLPIFVRDKSARANGACKERFTESQIVGRARSSAITESWEDSCPTDAIELQKPAEHNPTTGLQMLPGQPSGGGIDFGGNHFGVSPRID